jgi:hypothetical protein
MSGSYFTLNAKYNSLLALFNQFFPYPPSPYPPPADVMTLSTAQTATGLKTFSTLPQSSVVPTIGAQLVNKTYVDSAVPTPVNAVTIDGSQTLLTGIKTFTNLPDCSAVPISGSQLVNKTYVDGVTPATATNLAGGVASQIPYQSAPSTTSFIANGTAGQYLQSNGASAPSWATIPVIPSTPNLSAVLTAGNTANTGINMNGFSINNINTLTTNQAGLNFLPQATIQAISNTPINIPVYGGDHQILLKSAPVPIIDTLVVQTQFISSSGSIVCSAVGNGFQWLGTNNGEIFCYDSSISNWTLVAQFNGVITALYYAVGYDRLYIGGSFNSCSNPSSGNTYGNVAYIPTPSTSLIIPDNLIWSGATAGGFNSGVNAITGDGADNVYFGGNFTNNADATLILNYFACYDQATNVVVAIDSNSSNGFNGAVYNLDWLLGSICATGNFTTITTSGIPTTSFYCVVFAISGNLVSSVSALDGASTNLSTGINGYDFIDNDGSEFLVVINQSYTSPASGTIYNLIRVSTNGISSVSGSNSIFNPITSFFRKVSTGTTHALTTGLDYYIDSALATAMGNSYFTFNYIGSDTIYFNLQGVGSQWAFVGASYNNFLLGGGRQILWYNGAVFTTGYLAQTPVNGANLLLNWNGTYYVQICSIGSPTSWNPYT